MTLAEEELAFYAEYGRAISVWAEIEEGMIGIGAHFFPNNDERKMLVAGIFGLQGFRAKLFFVDRLLQSGIHLAKDSAERMKEWAELFKVLNTKSATRNDLAHFPTFSFPQCTVGRRFAICPWNELDPPPSQPPPGAICIKGLVRIRREFSDLRVDTLNLLYRLRGSGRQLAKDPLRPDDLPTIRQIADQMHAALGHPRQSLREKRRLEDEANAAASLRPPEGGKT